MIPRQKLDIGWSDLGYGLVMCFLKRDHDTARNRIENHWSSAAGTLVTLSVRTGFDLLLRQLALPEGSEILVSAVTLRDIVVIIERHGLRAVPVDIEPDTCSPRCDLLERAITPRCKAVLAAHLFGGRVDMTEIISVARRHNLLVFEDCAQAYAADGYRGHDGSDVAMFSFGPIKTATALGGAVFLFRDTALCRSVKSLQDLYPRQPQRRFLSRVIKYSLLKALSRRLPYSVFTALCRGLGRSHDQIINNSARGFAGGELTTCIRYRPCAALLALLERRLRRTGPDQLRPRVRAANLMISRLPSEFLAGQLAGHHSHWVFPIQSRDPDKLVHYLWARGFDATRGASNMYAVPASGAGATAPIQAARLMDRIVYLPVGSVANDTELQKLAAAVRHFATDRQPDNGEVYT